MTVEVYWNDLPLKAKVHEAFGAAVKSTALEAAALAKWTHVRESIRAESGTDTGHVVALAPDAKWLEFGTRAHEEAPRTKQAMKFPDGGFARGTIQHPAVAGHPFLRPAAASFPRIYIEEARARLL